MKNEELTPKIEKKSKYTIILHKYRSGKTTVEHIECLNKDLSIYLQDRSGWSIIHCFDGHLKDKLWSLRNHNEIEPLEEWKDYRFHSSASFYKSMFEKLKRLNRIDKTTKKQIALFDKIHDNDLPYEDWVCKENKICYIVGSNFYSTHHMIVTDDSFICNDFNSGHTLSMSHNGKPFEILKNGFEAFKYEDLKACDIEKIKLIII